MKKILFSIFCIFLSNYVNADIDVVKNIEDKVKINWKALSNNIDFLSTEEMQLKMLTFFISHEKEKISTKDILEYCLEIDNENENSCKNFVMNYITYIDADSNNCTQVSALIGHKNIKSQDGLSFYDINTYKDLLKLCEQYMISYKNVVENSIYGICQRVRDNSKKCEMYLKTYYRKKLLPNNKLSDKLRGKYQCILDLIETGEIDLPVSLMEKKCERKNNRFLFF